MEFLSNFHKETIIYRDFIRHAQCETEKKYLVSTSQDRKFTQTRCNNDMCCDVLLQLKLTKLHSELSPLQKLELGKTLDLTMQSNDARKFSSKNLDVAQTPTSRQDINRISIKGKQSMLTNVPKPEVFKDTSLSVMSPIDVVKNALMLGLKVARIRVGHVEEDLESIKRNCISEGMGVQIDMRHLANQCK